MADQTIRVGLIGAGANTRLRHIPGLQAIEGVEVVAVCNRSIESGHSVADAFGIEHVTLDPDDLFNDESIDAISIGTWPYVHRDFTVRALEAGKHVLCEARMAMDAGEAREMLAASQAHPELVAQRIATYARLVGRENVIAGTDCGFSQSAFTPRVHSSIMWAKLQALAEGAALATEKLWG